MPSPAIATTRPSACSCLHLRGLLLGQHLGDHLVDAELLRDRPRGGPAVAGEHDDPQAFVRAARGSPRACVSLIGSATPTRPAALPSTATNITVWPVARAAPRRARRAARRRRPALHQRAVAERDRAAVDAPRHALAGDGVERLACRERDAARLGARARSPRPAGARWRARGWRPARSTSASSKPGSGDDGDELRLALGQRAGLVHHQRVDLRAASRAPRRS